MQQSLLSPHTPASSPAPGPTPPPPTPPAATQWTIQIPAGFYAAVKANGGNWQWTLQTNNHNITLATGSSDGQLSVRDGDHLYNQSLPAPEGQPFVIPQALWDAIAAYWSDNSAPANTTLIDAVDYYGNDTSPNTGIGTYSMDANGAPVLNA